MDQRLEQFFLQAWSDYKNRVPQAQLIFHALEKRGELVSNDHIALRTLNFPGASKEDLAQSFAAYGYEVKGHYEFPEKKLLALHLEGAASLNWPKVFISELCVEKMSESVQEEISVLKSFCQNYQGLESFLAPRPWQPKFESYQKLVAESEYASWFYAHGWVVNHFTVNVNMLKSFSGLEELNLFIENLGCVLNSSGGKIKGNTTELLEQSSTMADMGEVEFLEGKFSVPTSYYEFAKRYPKSNGELFQGFVPASADKIFESTQLKGRKI